MEAYLNESFDGNLLHLTEPYQGSGFRPYRIDNKSFPADWATGGIAGKCDRILDQVLKYDVPRTYYTFK